MVKRRKTSAGAVEVDSAAPKAESIFAGGLFASSGADAETKGRSLEAAPLVDTFAKLFAPEKRTAPDPVPAPPAAKKSRGKKRAREEDATPEAEADAGMEDGEASEGKEKKKKEKPRMTKEELKERETRTLFVGNVPLDWDVKRLRTALKEACGEKYTGSFAPIWFREEPLKEKWTHGKLRKAGSIKKDYADDASDAKIAYVVLSTATALDTVRHAVHGLVADMRHKLRADGVGKDAKMQTFDRKRSVFVGNLPANCGEADLRTVFEPCGEVNACRVIRDKETKKCKGIAFVLFKERSSVKAALQYWGTMIRGYTIRVTKVEAQDKEEKETKPANTHPAEWRMEMRKRRKPKPKHDDQGFSKKSKNPGKKERSKDTGKRKKSNAPKVSKSRKGKGKKR